MPRKRSRAAAEAEIDMGAFSDIAFLLIIFFVLTTTIMRPTGREIAIPQAQTPQQKQVDEKTPSINVLPDKILYGETEDSMQEVSLDGLRAALQKRNMLSPDTKENDRMVVLEVGEEVIYDQYYKVMTMVSEAGGIVAIVEDEAKAAGAGGTP